MSAVEPAAIDAPAAQAEPTRLGLFLTFFQIGICGFGGVGPWARRIIVEERGWLDDRQYAELLGLCQVLPGPNVGNVSVMVGDRFYGLAGSILAFTGLMSGPMSILFVLAYLYDRFGELAYVNAAIGGVAAAAAGLFLGTALKIAERLKLTAPALALTATAFVAVGLLHWPLIYVVLALALVGILLAWRAQW